MFTCAEFIYIKDTNSAYGLGVFTNKDIAQGELIEICPVVALPHALNNLPIEIRTRVYDVSDMLSEVAYVLVFGCGSFYNHSSQENIHYTFESDNRAMRYKACRHISSGQQLFINYNGNASGASLRELDWFSLMNIRQLVVG